MIHLAVLKLAQAAATAVPLRVTPTGNPLELPGGAAAGAAKLPAQPSVDLSQLLGQAHQTPLAHNMPWLTHTFAGCFFALALGLIVLLAIQTTKQEGLSGTIGGRVDSPYRARLGGEAQLARLTNYVALGMVFFGTILAISGI
jgi:preprotein translocase subunit SecG